MACCLITPYNLSIKWIKIYFLIFNSEAVNPTNKNAKGNLFLYPHINNMKFNVFLKLIIGWQ